MAERRTLTDGLKATPKVHPPKAVDPALAREFIHGGTGVSAGNGHAVDGPGNGRSNGTATHGQGGSVGTSSASVPVTSSATAGAATPTPAAVVNRAPVSTRIREDFARALKRASLERQLAAITPNTLQDILEEAIEPWLRGNGYLP